MRLPLSILALLAALAGMPARADDLAGAQRLWLAGQKAQAVEQVEQALARTPDDLQLRFALGVMRMELGERAKALAIFTRLTQDFPDLADPYNNLAVLHAAAGELDEAKAALEQALRLQPEHAQAQENLGDVLLRLALRAYERAQKAAVTPTDALATKINRTLALTRELRAAP
ncbi:MULTISPECIES: tetratricopeptide repeat protein [Roseateles]|uniref:Tetratricopeptide repeat protein n=1 Tax=Pelomonas caseinilytica TaxID=2906763 RepID=A0ABS8XE78_9BURK|nr:MULTISPECIES: tetratricopeptide repeat protein [unclassified Roseateles]MCE4536878.1 tetratricopeptide repeat protein [Pelomonas sp. P7]HEV6967496.1 tetratricopeptide repeat protein [Roseateles sp.]